MEGPTNAVVRFGDNAVIISRGMSLGCVPDSVKQTRASVPLTVGDFRKQSEKRVGGVGLS